MNVQFLVNGLWVLGLWLVLFSRVQLEWDINEQYHYAYFVPFIAAYLLYLRWLDRPKPSTRFELSERTALMLVFLMLAFVVPLGILQEANPDWRLLYWLQGILSFALTIWMLWYVGGLAWVKHFGFAIVMLLFTIPWVSVVEQPLVLSLMRMVAAFTVEIVNLCGVHAIREGNVIHLSNTLVGVEEACSGVRSLQSTLMASFFLGELFRFSLGFRSLLLLLGLPLSVLFNLARTLFLTFAAHSGGQAFLDKWHDTAGNVAAIFAFVSVLLLAYILKRIAGIKENDVPVLSEAHMPKRLLPTTQAGMCLLLLVLSVPLAEAWYAWRGPEVNERTYEVSPDWSKLETEVKEREISDGIKAVLRYSEGSHYVWMSAPDVYWSTYYFRWDAGRISSFAGIHKPEVCLPSAGFTLVEESEPLTWKEDGFVLRMRAYEFEANGYTLFVFFSVWDNDMDAPVPLAKGMKDRVLNAWHGRRIQERRQLQTVVTGVSNMTDAKQKMEAVLDRLLNVHRLEGQKNTQ